MEKHREKLFLHGYNDLYFLPAATKLGQGNIFTSVCLSTGGGRGVCLSACWDTHPPRSRHPPGADPPPREQTPPGADTLPGADTPLGADPPQTRHPPRKQTASYG